MTLQTNEEGKLINIQTSREVLPIEVSGGVQSVHVPITQTSDTRRTEAVIRPHIIPIIFLPGIMGSNLKQKKDGADSEFKKYLWKTPRFEGGMESQLLTKDKAKEIIKAASKDNSKKVWQVSSPVSLALSKFFSGPVGRQATLNPETTTVDYMPDLSKGPGIFDKDETIDLAIALSRGWGSVSKLDYWPVMVALQKNLNQPYPDMIKPFEGKAKTPLSAENKDGAKDFSEKLPVDGVSRNLGKTPLVGGAMDWNKDQRAINSIEKTADEIWQVIHDAGKNDTPKYSSFNPISKDKGLFGQNGTSPEVLNEKKIQHAAAYHYRVYGVGYNWLNSNLYSANGGFRVTEAGGEDSNLDDCLNKVIDAILADIQANEDPDCKQVILVTHSMGGLVARAYQAKHADKVLGVIHGVMPATGAAAMYKRMRAGFGGVENKDLAGLRAVQGWAVAKVLGNDAYKTSVVLTHAVGALELAPSDSYGDPDIQKLTAIPSHIDHRAWLRVHAKGDEDGLRPLMALPVMGDPYSEIYESSDWYGLVPYIPKENPTELQNKRVDPIGNFNYRDMQTGEILGDLAYFRANVIMAQKYHMEEVTRTTYHPESYVQCFVGKTDMEKAFGRVVWHAESMPAMSLQEIGWNLTRDDGKGKLKLKHSLTGDKIEVSVSGKGKYDYGDATVPAVSGMAPAPHAKILFEQNDGQHDHQSSWNSVYAQRFAVYAVTCLIQKDNRAKD